jgi:transposase InsO family protein
VNKAVKAGYRLYRAAARHGSRAGEIDGLPHGRIATQFVHDVWCLDELTFPVWIRVPSAERAAWTSVLTDIVIIVDVRSTAVVGWHIVDPVGRVDEHGVQLAGGARVDDVFAALLSAAFTELAPDSTAQFAGFLPAVLRWDNHQAHKALAERLRQAEIGIDPFFIRKRRAISNSPVENRVGTLKRWTKGIKGHVDRHLPTDQVKNDAAVDQVRDRTRLAGSTSERRTERLPLDPCDLMDVAEARIAFNDIVRRYNFEHINRVFNQTAAQRFFRYLQPRHPRNGRDLLGLIEPRETTVGRNGIVHYEDNCEYRFDGIIEDAILMLDSTVIYRPDPLVRCLFVEREGRQHVLFPTLDVAERAATIARNQIAIARYLSDTAKEAREARYVAEIGSDARARAEEQYKHQQELYRNGGNGTAELAPNIEALRRAPEPEPANEEFDPYGADNLHAFVRRRNENGAQSDE